MESCERIKSNTLRINFDTMQKDKQERIYCVENALCQVYEIYIIEPKLLINYSFIYLGT